MFILCNSTITPPRKPTLFCSLIFVDHVLILYDYQMAFSPICSAVYALGLVRLISRCYVVSQRSTHPNRYLLVPGLSIPFVLACPVFACITLLYRSSLCSYRATVHILFSYIRTRSSVIGLPSSPTILVGFVVTSVISFDELIQKKSLGAGESNLAP